METFTETLPPVLSSSPVQQYPCYHGGHETIRGRANWTRNHQGGRARGIIAQGHFIGGSEQVRAGLLDRTTRVAGQDSRGGFYDGFAIGGSEQVMAGPAWWTRNQHGALHGGHETILGPCMVGPYTIIWP